MVALAGIFAYYQEFESKGSPWIILTLLGYLYVYTRKSVKGIVNGG